MLIVVDETTMYDYNQSGVVTLGFKAISLLSRQPGTIAPEISR